VDGIGGVDAAVSFGQSFALLPPTPSVRSACALVSPVWAYITAVYDQMMDANDYITSVYFVLLLASNPILEIRS